MKKLFTIITILLLTCLFLNFATWRIEQIENNPEAYNKSGHAHSVEIFKNK